MIGRSILFVYFLQGPLVVDVIMIDGSVKCNRYLGFDLKSLRVILKGAVNKDEYRNPVSVDDNNDHDTITVSRP